jgi:hypothetical protein
MHTSEHPRGRARAHTRRRNLSLCESAGWDYAKAGACTSESGVGMSLDATLSFVDDKDDDVEGMGEGEGGGAEEGLGKGKGKEESGVGGEVGASGVERAAGVRMSAGEKIGMWNSCLFGGYHSYVEYPAGGGEEPYMILAGREMEESAGVGERGGAGNAGSEGAGKTLESDGGNTQGGGGGGEEEEEEGPLAHAVAERNVLFLALRDEGVASMVSSPSLTASLTYSPTHSRLTHSLSLSLCCFDVDV